MAAIVAATKAALLAAVVAARVAAIVAVQVGHKRGLTSATASLLFFLSRFSFYPDFFRALPMSVCVLVFVRLALTIHLAKTHFFHAKE